MKWDLVAIEVRNIDGARLFGRKVTHVELIRTLWQRVEFALLTIKRSLEYLIGSSHVDPRQSRTSPLRGPKKPTQVDG
jgi:hypothetical protein